MSLQRRLERLEESVGPAWREWPDWSAQGQVEDFMRAFNFYRDFHPSGDVRYPATDREIHLAALLWAAYELGEEGGEHRFPSGLVVRLRPNGDVFETEVSRRVAVEDLPEHVRRHLERMDPKEQRDRERFLYEHRDKLEARFDLAERRIAWHQENGDDRPTPKSLLDIEEAMRERSRRSKQGDRELLERNRAACGLAPLTPEQIERWGLEGTTFGGEGRR